jgi:prevent-host-death family protein
MNKPTIEGEVPVIGAFQAKTELSRLLRQTRAGKRFIITQRGKPIAELIPFQQPSLEPVWGDMEGGIQMSEEFDEPLEDFAEYME